MGEGGGVTVEGSLGSKMRSEWLTAEFAQVDEDGYGIASEDVAVATICKLCPGIKEAKVSENVKPSCIGLLSFIEKFSSLFRFYSNFTVLSRSDKREIQKRKTSKDPEQTDAVRNRLGNKSDHIFVRHLRIFLFPRRTKGRT